MKKLTIFLILSIVATSCGQFSSDNSLTNEYIDRVISSGEYPTAKQLIKYKIATEKDLSERDLWNLYFKMDLMDRVSQDFCKDDSTVFAELIRYYPKVTREEMLRWEESGALEYKTIEGEKKYFRNAARNVFRIDPAAERIFDDIHGSGPDELSIFLSEYIPKVVSTSIKKKTPYVNPVNFKIRYTLTVNPDEIPSGEVVRVWMPYLQDEDIYSNVKLLATSQPDYIIAPPEFSHRSIYMERRVEKGKPTEFWYELSYTATNKFSDFDPNKIAPYDKWSQTYRHYTSERKPHIVFSNRIRRITDSLTRGENNPYRKSVLIFDWICDNYPWASALEYSTIDNIPEYVLDKKHGDCGQVALLFITMARYAGIPAKWESGWMLHPGDINLHDWVRVYYEGVGWVGLDQSFGRILSKNDLKNNVRRGSSIAATAKSREDDKVYHFYTHGMDAYRFIVNTDYSMPLYPAKVFPRSETVDFQRGEVEWRGGNLYFGRWNYDMEVL